MRRREFLLVAGGAAASWPLPAHAQQPAKLPTIGYLGPNTPSIDTYRLPPFVQRLRELGWIEGRTVNIEYQWAQGSRELADKIAAEFVRRKVDIIVTAATPPTMAAKQATSTIPIVFAAVGDPVGTGLVASLARPGGNITGLSLQQTDAAGKRLELLHEAIPGIRRVAIMANAGNLSAVLDMRETEAAAQTAGLEAIGTEIRNPEDITPAINAFRGRADALYVCNDPLAATHRIPISTAAMEAHLPTMFGGREYVEVGGLMSFGPSFPNLFGRAADYVDKILRGAKPADLPVEQPTKFDLIVNLKTANALALALPPTLLARADEVIE
jgi:putative tryptophan/tyrosine transport system substrate-binding protein